jgi:acetyltransferase-like isoleucine patch superfamily enzyme
MVFQKNDESPVYIEDNVWIGSNCTIGKGVTIGTGSIIAANSFVNKSIPANSIAGGVPAKIIKKR